MKKTTNHAYAIDLLIVTRALVNKVPNNAKVYLPEFADMILRAMDFTNEQSTAELVNSITKLIRAMLIKYRNVAFYQDKELLAIGTIEGRITIYGLKQHQKLKVLEGHKTMPTALAFSKSGNRLASYSDSEKVLRVWQIMGGMLLFAGRINKSIIINIDTHSKKIKVEDKEIKHPSIEFGIRKNQIRLYLPPQEAYEYTF